MYGWNGYAGFAGQDYYGLLAQANLQDCDSRDSACVSNNVAKQAAVEQTWLQYMANPNGAPDNLQLTFKPQTDAEVSEFYSANPAYGGNVVDTRGIESSNLSTPPAPVYVPPPAPSPSPARVPVATRTAGASAQTMIGSPAAAPPSATSWTLPASASSIPWWGWAGGAAALLFAFKGGR